jgi:hypothetical protein
MLTCLAFPAVLLQILSSLDSPHIVKYFDSFLHEGRLHIVSCQSSPCHSSLAALSAAGMMRGSCEPTAYVPIASQLSQCCVDDAGDGVLPGGQPARRHPQSAPPA